MNDKIDELYDALKADGAVKKSRENFRSYVDDADNRQKLYDALKEDGAVKSPTFEEFSRKLGYNATQPTPAAQGLPVNPATFAPMAPAAPSSGAVNVRAPFADAQATQQYEQQKPTSPTAAQNEQEQPLGPDGFAKQMAMDQQLGQRSQQLSRRLDAIRKGNQPFSSTERRLNPATGKMENVYYTKTGEATNTQLQQSRRNAEINEAIKGPTVNEELQEAYAERDRLQQEIELREKQVDANTAEEAEEAIKKLPQKQQERYGELFKRITPREGNKAMDAQLSMLKAALRSNEERINTLERERDNPNYIQVVGKGLTSADTWLGGFNSMADMITMLRYGEEKMEGSEGAAQEAMLKNRLLADDAKARYGGQNDTGWQRFGDISAEAIPFLAEFMLTGGGFSGIKAGARLGEKAALKYGKNKVGKWLLKNIGSTADDIVRASIMANTTGVGRTVSDILDRRLGELVYEDGEYKFVGGKSVGRSVYEGEMAATLQYLTEFAGSKLDAVGKVVGKGVGKGLERIGAARVSELISRMSGSEWNRMLAKLQINDYWEEVAEEELNIILNAMLVGDNKFSDLWDKQTQGDILGGMAMSIGLMRAPGMVVEGGAKTYNTAQYYRYKHNTDKADRVASVQFGADNWEVLREQIDNTENKDMGALLAEIADNADMNDGNKKAAADYIVNLMKMRGYNMRTMKNAEGKNKSDSSAQAVADEREDQAYGRGYDADEQGRQDAMMELAMSDPSDPDHAEKQAAVDGINQRINDDADMQVAQQREAYNLQRNDDDGSLHPATMSVDGQEREVYIKSGLVTTGADGSIDIENSGKTIIVYDPVEGKNKMVSPADIRSLGPVTTAEQLEADLQNQRDAFVQQQQDAATNRFNPQPGQEIDMPDGGKAVVLATDGDSVTLQMPDGTQQSMAIADIQQIADGVMMEDYRQRHPEAEQPSEPATEAKGAPETFSDGMVLTVKGENGEEQQMGVIGRASYSAQPGSSGYREDPNGKYVALYVPGEEQPRYMLESKLREQTVDYIEQEAERPAAEVEQPTEGAAEQSTAGGAVPAGESAETAAAPAVAPEAEIYNNVKGEYPEAYRDKVENTVKIKAKRVTDTKTALDKATAALTATEYGSKEEATAKRKRDEAQQAYDAAVADSEMWNAVKSLKDQELLAEREAKDAAEREERERRRAETEAARKREQEAYEAEMARRKAEQEEKDRRTEAALEYMAKMRDEAAAMGADFPIEDDAAAMEVMNDLEPHTLEEVAAWLLSDTKGKMKIDPEEMRRHTGYSSTDMNKFPFIFKKDGVSPEKFGEHIEQKARENGVSFDEADTNAGFNALLNVLGEVGGLGDLKNYIKNARRVQAERLHSQNVAMAAAVQTEDDWIAQHGGMSREEYASYINWMEDAVEQGKTEITDEEFNQIFNTDDTRTATTDEESQRGGAAESGTDGAEARQAATAADDTRRGGEDAGGESTAPTAVAERIAAAEAQTDTNPTEGQKKAGNYAKGHLTLDGYNISIEQPKGSIRRGVDADGRAWEQEMHNTYGYIRGTEGVDGDHIDVFLSDDPTQGNVFVIDQVNKDGSFDEHKVMYGFPDAESARAAYLSNYEDGWQGLGTITEVSKDEFKKWVESSHRKTKPFSEYKSVKPEGGQNEQRQPSTAEDVEAGGAVVDRLQSMGVEVSTDIAENRKVRKQAERDNSESGKIHNLKTSDGKVYGFTYRGKLYLDPREIDAELPLHEYGHLWTEAFRRLNPEGWNDLVETMKQDAESWNIVKQLYPDLKTDSEIADEVIATFSGKNGAAKLKEELERMADKNPDYKSRWGNIYNNIVKAIQDFWKTMGDFLGIKYESPEQVYDQVLRDFASGMNPRARVEEYLKERDAEYMNAVESGDEDKAKELFDAALRENIGNGITPFVAVGGYRGNMDRLARGVKSRDPKVIAEVADLMAPLIPENAVLVPTPSHSGTSTDMLDVANAISKRTGAPVADVLRSEERKSQYEAKRQGQPITSAQMGIHVDGELPEGMTPVIIDNVVNTGNTAEACVKALGKGVVVSLADAANRYRHVASLKSANPIARDRNGKVVPLSQRFDLGGSNYLAKQKGQPAAPTAEQKSLTKGIVGWINSIGIPAHAAVRKGQEVLNKYRELVRALRGYHGSGADFDRFDHSHMGEGEGAQAYGYGTYITEVEGIGRTYAEHYGKANVMMNGVPIRQVLSNEDYWDWQFANFVTGHERTLDELKESIGHVYIDGRIAGSRSKRVRELQKQKDRLLFAIDNGEVTIDRGGAEPILYTVDIPDDDGSNYLSYDKPATDEQVDRIKNALLSNDKFKEDSREEYNFMSSRLGDVQYIPPFEEWMDNRAGVIAMGAKERGQRVYDEIAKLLDSEKKASELLHAAGFVGIKYPAEYRSGGRGDNAKNYVIFDENDLKITDKVKFFRDKDGEVIGYTLGGEIYIDPRYAKPETPVHEYTHLIVHAIRANNPQVWERWKQLVHGEQDFIDFVKAKYPEYSENEDDFWEEVIANYTGRKGGKRLEDEMSRQMRKTPDIGEKARIATIFHKLRDLLRRFWDMTKDIFSGSTKGIDNFQSMDDVVDLTLAALANKFDPRAAQERARDARDREYLDAVDRGDMETAQRMVNKAAKAAMPDTKVVDENGMPLRVYHITDNDFNIFHSGNFAGTIYFSDNKSAAKKAARGKNKTVNVFLNVKKPVNTKDNPIPWYDAEDNIKVAKWKEEGYDGVYVRDESGVSIAVFHPSQIKSADPVTYDDNGNVIPLSERFDSGKEDIRYQKGKSGTYTTRDGVQLSMMSLFESNENLDDNANLNERSSANGDLTELRLRKLEPGETCHVERRYEENKSFSFTGKEKIESMDDVAYIFKQLENAAVENSFIALVKDGKPIIIHTGMGGYASSPVDIRQAVAAYMSINPEQVYFVHNHPSGSLRASREDRLTLNLLREVFGNDVVQDGIIIDTTSGKYGVFGPEIGEGEFGWELGEKNRGEVPMKVYEFSKQVFSKDWKPQTAYTIAGSEGVAEFISSHRLGEHPKMSFIVVNNQNQVVGNFFLPWTALSEIEDVKATCTELSNYINLAGGMKGVIYGNYQYSEKDKRMLQQLAAGMNLLHTPLLDVVHVDVNDELGYHSAHDSGVMEPEAEYVTPAREAGESILDYAKRVADDYSAYESIVKALEVANGGVMEAHDDSVSEQLHDTSREMYERLVGSSLNQFTEAMQDSMKSLESLMKAMLGDKDLKKEEVAGFENPYLVNNAMSSASHEQIEVWHRYFIDPLKEEIRGLLGKVKGKEWKAAYTELVDYLMAKHGLERNDVFAKRDAKKAYSDECDAAIRDINNTRSLVLKELKKKLNDNKIDQDTYNSEVEKTNQDIEQVKTRFEQERDAKIAALEENPQKDARYRAFRGKDYSGLTALTGSTKDASDIDEAENKALADLESRHHAKLIDDEAYKQEKKQIKRLAEKQRAGIVAMAEHKAEKMVAEYESKHDTKALWKKINAATNSTLFKLADSGIMSAEQHDRLRDMFQYYIPLQGFNDTVAEDLYAYMGGKGTLGVGSLLKGAKGRKSKADDPLATIILNGEAAIRQANRNLMKQKFLNFVLNHPGNLVSVHDIWLRKNDTTGQWERYFEADLREDDSPEVVASKMQAFEDKMAELAAQDPAHYKRGRELPDVPYRVIEKKDMDQHQVLVRRNGQTVVLTINGNPRAAQALNGLTNPDVDTEKLGGKIVNGIQKFTRFLATNYTSRFIDFMAANWVRDAFYTNDMAIVREDAKYASKFHKEHAKTFTVNTGILFKEWSNGKLQKKIDEGTANKYERYFREFMLNGGETGWTNQRDLEKHKRDLERDLRHAEDWNVRAWKAFTGFLDIANRAIENNARFAAYVSSRDMGRSITRSIWDAKEVSVNFNTKGAGSKMAGAKGQTTFGDIGAVGSGIFRTLFPFWNASVQGISNIYRAAKRRPGRFALRILAVQYLMGALIPLISQWLCGDDDDDPNSYYNLPEYVRRSNLCFRFTKSMPWITLPLPIEFRAPYGLGELSMGLITGKEHYTPEEAAKQFAMQISQVLPLDFMEGGGGWHVLMPGGAKPALEAQANESWSGLPIYKESSYDDYKANWTKGYKNTSKPLTGFTKGLNELTADRDDLLQAAGNTEHVQGYINWNPAVIEYLLRGYLGGLYSTANQLVKVGETIAGVREFEWRNMPVANRFIKEGDERTQARKLQNEYFYYVDEYEGSRKRLKDADKENMSAEQKEERQQKLDKIAAQRHYWVVDAYKPLLDALHDQKQNESEYSVVEIEELENSLRRQMVDLIHKVDDNKELPKDSIDKEVDKMLAENFERGGYTRHSAANRIANRLGGTDSYGGGSALKTEYGKVYERKRDYVDMAEDVLLQVAIKEAKEENDVQRQKGLEAYRRKITEAKEPLGYPNAKAEVIDNAMARVRTLRRQALDKYGIDYKNKLAKTEHNEQTNPSR